MKNLRMFILNSGQEVIAQEVSDVAPNFPDAFVVDKPFIVQLVPQGPDSYGFALFPLSPSNPDGRIRVYNNSLVGDVLDIPTDIADMYTRRTSSIEIVTALPGQIK